MYSQFASSEPYPIPHTCIANSPAQKYPKEVPDKMYDSLWMEMAVLESNILEFTIFHYHIDNEHKTTYLSKKLERLKAIKVAINSYRRCDSHPSERLIALENRLDKLQVLFLELAIKNYENCVES